MIKFNGLSGDIEQQGPYSPYKPLGLCRGCVLGTFSTLKSGMSPIILAVVAHVPTSLRFTNGNIT